MRSEGEYCKEMGEDSVYYLGYFVKNYKNLCEEIRLRSLTVAMKIFAAYPSLSLPCLLSLSLFS